MTLTLMPHLGPTWNIGDRHIAGTLWQWQTPSVENAPLYMDGESGLNLSCAIKMTYNALIFIPIIFPASATFPQLCHLIALLPTSIWRVHTVDFHFAFATTIRPPSSKRFLSHASHSKRHPQTLCFMIAQKMQWLFSLSTSLFLQHFVDMSFTYNGWAKPYVSGRTHCPQWNPGLPSKAAPGIRMFLQPSLRSAIIYKNLEFTAQWHHWPLWAVWHL